MYDQSTALIFGLSIIVAWGVLGTLVWYRFKELSAEAARYKDCWVRIDRLQRVLKRDAIVMSRSPIVQELTERYQHVIGEDWRDHAVESADNLRVRLHVDPLYYHNTTTQRVL